MNIPLKGEDPLAEVQCVVAQARDYDWEEHISGLLLISAL